MSSEQKSSSSHHPSSSLSATTRASGLEAIIPGNKNVRVVIRGAGMVVPTGGSEVHKSMTITTGKSSRKQDFSANAAAEKKAKNQAAEKGITGTEATGGSSRVGKDTVVTVRKEGGSFVPVDKVRCSGGTRRKSGDVAEVIDKIGHGRNADLHVKRMKGSLGRESNISGTSAMDENKKRSGSRLPTEKTAKMRSPKKRSILSASPPLPPLPTNTSGSSLDENNSFDAAAAADDADNGDDELLTCNETLPVLSPPSNMKLSKIQNRESTARSRPSGPEVLGRRFLLMRPEGVPSENSPYYPVASTTDVASTAVAGTADFTSPGLEGRLKQSRYRLPLSKNRYSTAAATASTATSSGRPPLPPSSSSSSTPRKKVGGRPRPVLPKSSSLKMGGIRRNIGGKSGSARTKRSSPSGQSNINRDDEDDDDSHDDEDSQMTASTTTATTTTRTTPKGGRKRFATNNTPTVSSASSSLAASPTMASIPTPSSSSSSSSTTPLSISSAAAAAALINSSQYLAYSWDSLRLGEELGTAALNEYMYRLRGWNSTNSSSGGGVQTNDTNNVDEIGQRRDDVEWKNDGFSTAQQTLQIMNTLRVRTCLPPKGSELHRVVQNRFDNSFDLHETDVDGKESDSDDETKDGASQRVFSPTSFVSDKMVDPNGGPAIPSKTLSRLYEFMCSQDADDGSSTRREAHYMSAKACVEKLRSLENKACELKVRESQVLERGRELGLIPLNSEDMCRFLGYRIPDDNFT